MVTYAADGSWLELLASRAAALKLPISASVLRACEDLFRAVLDYACDLVQNAVDIVANEVTASASRERSAVPTTTVVWRTRHSTRSSKRFVCSAPNGWARRISRRGAEPMVAPNNPGSDSNGRGPWSRRIRTGEHQGELVGLALSGGGIRSATFGLGVLQHLQKVDPLRKVDYLSTVSGGGYIGSWLVGNVHRTQVPADRAD